MMFSHNLTAGQRPLIPVADLRPDSDFSLLSHLQRIIYLDAEIADYAFQLGQTELPRKTGALRRPLEEESI
jgi:hypothetical protein